MEAFYPVSVACANSVQKAQELIEKELFDAIVCDYEMPGITGIEFLRRLRNSGDTRPFIIFTGRGREEVIIEALNEGADGYVRKGADPKVVFAELFNILNKTVEKKRNEIELKRTKERLESLITNSFDAVVLFDLEGRIISTNPAFEKIYGWSQEEVKGKVLPMVPERERGQVIEYFRTVAKTGRPFNYTGLRLRKDGEKMLMNMSVSPVYDNDGNVVAIAGIGRDVSDVSRALKEAAFREEELRITLASIADGVIATDISGKVTLINEAAQKLTGHTEQEALGKHIDEIFRIRNELTGESVEVPVKRVLSSGMIQGLANSTVLISKDGTEYVISDAASPIRDEGEKILGVVLVFRNETEKRKVQRRISLRQAVSDVLVRGFETGQALQHTVEALQSQLSASVVELWLLDRKSDLLKRAAVNGSERFSDFIKEGESNFSLHEDRQLKALIEEGRSNQVEVEHSSLSRKNVAVSSGLKTAIAVPIKSNEGPCGLLLLFFEKSMNRDQELLNTLSDIGFQIGLYISKERKSELLELRNRVLEVMSDTLLLAHKEDSALLITYCNPAFEHVMSINANDAMSRDLFSLMTEIYGEEVALKFKSSFEANTSRSSEILKCSRGGRELYLDTSFFCVSKESWVLLQKNITEVVETLDMLQKANQKLKLIYNVGRHDLINNLQAIETYVQLISLGDGDNDIAMRLQEAVERIKEQFTTMREIQDSGAPRWFNLRKIFEASSHYVQNKINVEYIGPEVEIFADPLIDRVFHNLVTNTLRHGGKAKNIMLTVKKNEGVLEIIYEDDGRGIPDDIRSQLFDELGNRAMHGLRFVKDILKITGIDVREEGKQGQGVRFVMSVSKGNYRIFQGENIEK